jgi:hypothetical protein
VTLKVLKLGFTQLNELIELTTNCITPKSSGRIVVEHAGRGQDE